MDLMTAFLIALGCYLIGSFSFARTAVRILAPQKDIENIPIQVPGTNQTMRYNTIGATAAGMILGKKMGLMVGILDMVKVIAPVVVLRFAYPQNPEIMLVGTSATTLGHIFPVFHRFKGGGGYSTIFGGLLVISPLGAIICSICGMILGLLVFRSFPLMYAFQFLLIIPWMIFRFHTLPYVLFAVLVNILFFLSWIPAISIALKTKKPDRQPTLREMMRPYPMGGALIHLLEKINFRID